MSPQPNQVNAGDYTGRQKAEQSKKALQDQRDAANAMSMASAAEAEEIEEGVFDPRTQERIDSENGTVDEVVVTDAPSGFFNATERVEDEPVFSGKETPEEMEPYLASHPEPAAPQFLLSEPYVRIRTNQDVDNMTFGFVNGEPNNMSFKAGYLYEIPRDVAEHLNSRGVIGRYEGAR